MSASFSFPTTIRFGAGTIRQLPAELDRLNGKRPLIVTDKGLTTTAAFRALRDLLPADISIFCDVHSNPIVEDVENATSAFIDSRCDCVIGIGGGSALDVAKVVRLRAKILDPDLTEVPGPEVHVDLKPFVAIPTTAGTGSEVGRSSVITIGGQKRVIFHPALLANVVILDPELTVELPAKLTAATGADALTHCIESFTSPTFHPLCDGIALEGIRLICQSLRRAVATPSDLDARGSMLVAATMGGIAFQKDLGAAHSLAHPLSATCNLHHGLANALVLPAVMRFNAARKPGVYRRVGEAIGLERPTDALTIEAVESFFRDIDITGGLRAQGVNDSQLNALADQAFADSCHQTNPVPVTRQDLYRLYEQAM